MQDLRYPIGRFAAPEVVTPEQRQRWIEDIAAAPSAVRAVVRDLTEPQLDTPYRPEGWTVRQVVHHLPDSHMNSYIRYRLALTENEPTIKPYHEHLWAELSDARVSPAEISLVLLESLHQRWVTLLRSMSDADFQLRLVHPGSGSMNLDKMTGLYAWHGKHHVAHVQALRDRMGW